MITLKKNFLLILIIALAAILRFTNLSQVPSGFNDDEAAFGYNAYSIVKTGHDEWGRRLPFPVFESFGDWKLVGYLYLTAVSVFIFGLNEFATRFPSTLFGVLTVIATYLLAQKLFNKNIALISALFLAISPWHIVASRNAFESDLLSFFITIATYLFIKSIKDIAYLKFSLALFAAAFYIYRSAWLFIPLFLIVIYYLHREQIKKVKTSFLLTITAGLILIFPLVPSFLTFRGQSRFIQESFITGTTKIGILNDVNSFRGTCSAHLPGPICVLVYNKYIFFIKSYVGNYFKNLSYEAFFERASPTGFQSFSTRGVFYLFELPLIICGLIYLFGKKHNSLKILITWILLSPVGASIAGTGNYGRLNLVIPAFQILEATGLYAIVASIKNKVIKKTALAAAALVIIFSVTKLTIDMFYIEPVVTSSYQRYGYKELFSYLESQKENYNNFYISKKIDYSHQYIQYLFFERVDPNYFQKNVQRTHTKDSWVSVDMIGNYFFTPSASGLEKLPDKSLLIIGAKEVNLSQEPIYVIKYLSGDVGFEIYSNDPLKK